MEKIDFSVWEKINLVVAEIENVEDISGSDKLYKLNLDVGKYGKRTICAGVKKNYKKEELIGKKIVLFENLAPKKLKSIESQGMLLAATNDDHTKVMILFVDKEISNGWKIN
ncbi:MAG: hypothetical protein QW103_02410 [Candidatus Pacearchaeota archaeon]